MEDLKNETNAQLKVLEKEGSATVLIRRKEDNKICAVKLYN